MLAAGIVFGLAFLLRRHRNAPGAGALAVMMLAAGLWDLGAGLELSAADHFYKVLWAKLQYLGIVAIPVAWLAFAVVYTGRESWLSRRNLALLCVVPAITLLLVATNEYHGLIWSQVELTSDGGIVDLYLEHGPAFWLIAAFDATEGVVIYKAEHDKHVEVAHDPATQSTRPEARKHRHRRRECRVHSHEHFLTGHLPCMQEANSPIT